MENFIVSARKYRPSTFDTVVGQLSITSTLKNAIKNNQLAQAFLFCGPRGVGKTSCARILAKTINCFNPTENIEACDNCESCNGFNQNHSFNIHELDAASNNGVDKIRELVDQVRFAPQIGKYNIYIIDEVHMLSQAAFNAFLKTLEEPPSHAIFILATTEKHKIIATILSRCQIFDFKRIQINDIANHLKYVSKNEGIEADEDALHIIAQKADGALRDSLSLFDQIVSFCGKKLDYNSVINNLNILDYDYFFKATDAILNHNIPNSLNLFNQVLTNGFDGQNYINGLAEHFRNLLVCKDPSTLELLEVSQSVKTKFLEQSQSCNQPFLLFGLDLCNKADINYRISKNQRLLIELTLMKMCGYSVEPNNTDKKKTFNVKPNLVATEKPSLVEKPEPKQANVVENQETQNITKEDKKDIYISSPTPSNQAKLIGTEIKRKSRTISINPQDNIDDVKEEEEKKEEINNEVKFTQQELEKSWKDFYSKMKDSGKHNFLTILKSHVGKKIDDNNIIVTLENKVQEDVFKEDYLILLKHLKNSLLNDRIKLVTKIEELKEAEMVAYTDEDKFKKMTKKNDSLLKLRDHFNLEIDYK